MRSFKQRSAALLVLLLIALLPAVAGEFKEAGKSTKVTGPKTAHKAKTVLTPLSSDQKPGIYTRSATSAPLASTNSSYSLVPAATPLAALKFLPDGAQVCVRYKSVVWLDNITFYVEETDGSCGLRAQVPTGSPIPDSLGSVISFSGTLQTDHERYIVVDPLTLVNHFTGPMIRRVGMKNIAIGGYPLNALTPGFPDSIHLFNIGLAVKVWGQVQSTQYDPFGRILYIDDGSRIKDGTLFNDQPNIGLRVRYDGELQPQTNDLVTVNGVASAEIVDLTPTPGDELLIPAIKTCNGADLTIINPGTVFPNDPPPARSTMTGNIRALGQAAPGINARVYTNDDSIIISNVTDTLSSYSIKRVPASGTLVTASAAGFKSHTVVAVPGQPIPDLVLEPYEQLTTELSVSKTKIRACSSDTSKIQALLRDCEGNGTSGKSLKFVTTRGAFVESGTKEYLSTTNSNGVMEANLRADPDSPGEAIITVTQEPGGLMPTQISIEITGMTLDVSADPAYLTSPGSSTISVSVADDTGPMSGQAVYFTTDFGGFTEAGGAQEYTATTDGNGSTTATLALSSPGTATVRARCENSCANQFVGWVVVPYRGSPWKPAGVGYSCPLLVDVSSPADQKPEIIVVGNDGRLHVWQHDGTLLWETGAEFGINATNSVSAANIDGDPDGKIELFLPSETEKKVYGYSGSSGMPLAGWPTHTNYPFRNVAAVLYDINTDGVPEVMAGDECCYVFSWNGTGNWENKEISQSSFLWRNLTGSANTVIYGSTIAVGDLDNDPLGMPDVVVGTNSSEIYAFPGDAWGDFTCTPGSCPPGALPPWNLSQAWPEEMITNPQSSPVVADIDKDGKNEVFIACDRGYFEVRLGNGTWLTYKLGSSTSTSPETPDPPEASAALADINGDTYIDIVVAISEGKIMVFDGSALARDQVLSYLPGWERGIKLNSGSYEIRSSPVIGDVNDDGKPEILVGATDGNLYCLYSDGINHTDSQGHMSGPIAWTKSCVSNLEPTAQIFSSAAIGDIDNDGNVDVVVGSTSGLYLFALGVPYHADRMPWPTFHHDNARTGSLATTAPMNYGSIVGRITQNGSGVTNYEVEIKYDDDSTVYQPVPHQGTPRPRVYTVGDPLKTDAQQANRGGFSINQLTSGCTYKLMIGPKGFSTPEKTVTVTIPAGGGLAYQSIDLAN